MTDKPKIIIEVSGGVADWHSEGNALDLVDVELIDHDVGPACDGCGETIPEGRALAKLIPAWPDTIGHVTEYIFCPRCALERGITEQTVVVSREDAFRNRITLLGLDPETALDDLVIEAKSLEASAINNFGLERQVDYLIECGVTPDDLEA